ncbi:hypothetical protein E2C01_043372 [Portunus trituberculatus]|uniref:Uncharacterized protein n=1 Tax=Portunus trituberculatus TaxID=210409 RepID=A0A5B7FW80_PORTR|nr:hypothetical protein [Portunus trituberculatus]
MSGSPFRGIHLSSLGRIHQQGTHHNHHSHPPSPIITTAAASLCEGRDKLQGHDSRRTLQRLTCQEEEEEKEEEEEEKEDDEEEEEGVPGASDHRCVGGGGRGVKGTMGVAGLASIKIRRSAHRYGRRIREGTGRGHRGPLY